eukprot:m.97584 g.97584  ORF g.97584 m.97584 type:complete len:573 (+) comp15536_c0_seq2:800-2518(+)
MRLVGGHGLADAGDVGVVPGVVVDDDGAVGHGADLVAVVPPGHDLCVLRGVVAQPVVGLAEVVEDGAGAVVLAGGEDDRRGGVGLRGDPGAVVGVHAEEDGHDEGDGQADGVARGVALAGLAGLGRSRGRGGLDAVNVAHVGAEHAGDANAGQDAGDGGEDKHEADHDAGEVDAGDAVEDDEDVLVGEAAEAEVEADRHHHDHEVQVKVVRGPGRGLVLGDRGDDGDVVLGVGGVQHRVEAAGPGRNLAEGRGHADCGDEDADRGGDQGADERVVLLLAVLHLGVEPVDQRVDLAEAKGAERSHVLARVGGLEADKGDLHGEQRAKHVDGREGHVDAVVEAAHGHEGQDVQRNEVDQEDIATPGGDHVKVGHGADGRPAERAGLDSLDPEVVRVDHAEDGNGLVIIGTRHRARNVAGHNGNEAGSHEAGAPVLQLLGDQVGDDGGERGEERGEEDADVADVHGHVDVVHEVEDERGGDHEARVDGAADDAAERVPGAVVKPVVEVVEALLHQVLRGAVVEVRVKLVDHALVADDGKEAAGKGQQAGQRKDRRRDQRLGLVMAHQPKDFSAHL